DFLSVLEIIEPFFPIDYENKVETLMFLPCFLFLFSDQNLK
ncbi:hypothetical protein HMPREF1354_01136, partial [Enterococcus faecium 514]